MRKVFKYDLDWGFVGQPFQVDMPHDAEILSLGIQDREPKVWALVTPRYDTTPTTVLLIGTGHEMPEGSWSHVDTIQDGPFVWHLFVPKGASR